MGEGDLHEAMGGVVIWRLPHARAHTREDARAGTSERGSALSLASLSLASIARRSSWFALLCYCATVLEGWGLPDLRHPHPTSA
jgi:hypothetical protein